MYPGKGTAKSNQIKFPKKNSYIQDCIKNETTVQFGNEDFEDFSGIYRGSIRVIRLK